MEQVCLCPWCCLKTAASISSKSCFLEKCSPVRFSQPGANLKAFPSTLPSQGGDGLGTQAQEGHKCPQPWLTCSLQAENSKLTGQEEPASSPPMQWLCKPRAASGQGLKTEFENIIQEVGTDFGGTGKLIYTSKVPVYKTRPLEEQRTLFLWYFWVIPLRMFLLVWHNME